MTLPGAKTSAFWLALLRIYAGFFWLAHGIPKFLDGEAFLPPSGVMQGFLTQAAAHMGGWYGAFLTNLVLPHAWVFGQLVRLGEVLAGCSLLLGFYTRLGGLVGTFLALNYMAAKGLLASPEGWSGLDGAAVVLSAIHLVLPTGRMLGIDGLLGRVQAPHAVPLERVEPEFVDESPIQGPPAGG